MKQGEKLLYVGRVKRRARGSGVEFLNVEDLAPYCINIALINYTRNVVHCFKIYKDADVFATDAFDTTARNGMYSVEAALVINGTQVVATNECAVIVESSVLGKEVGESLPLPEPEPSSPISGSVDSGEYEYIIELARSGSEAEINGWSDSSELLTFVMGTLVVGEGGYTPYIGDNGNWWINGEDTGKVAQGDIGIGIKSITLSSTEGLVKTYTILFTDGSSTTFSVSDGAQGDKGETGDVHLMSFDIVDGVLYAQVPEGGNIEPSINDSGELIIKII